MNGEKKQPINNEMLKVIRTKLKLTQPELGEMLGCHFTDISKVERGQVTPDWLTKFAVLLKLLNDAGLTYDDVVMEFPEPMAREKPGEYIVSE